MTQGAGATSRLVEIITSKDSAVRDLSLDAYVGDLSLEALLAECAALEAFRRERESLYERVRALFFLYAIHRFELPRRPEVAQRGLIPYPGYVHMLNRRFEEAVHEFRRAWSDEPAVPLASALAAAYRELGFQTLADQVRRSVRSVRGNQWMFRMGHPEDHPLRVRPELTVRPSSDSPFPLLREATPVRMDLSHSGWSDIFFLGMDYPEGARVLNVSIDLGVRGRDRAPQPPIETYFRVIDEPLLRLTSIDLGVTVDITELAEVFDFARDYLGLVKAGIIASGLVPPGLEGSEERLSHLLATVVGEGHGVEVVSSVNNIPKGSRLAVSTNLLASLIAVCMRATGQTDQLEGIMLEQEKRLVAARAILGEWLAGSGGGWQDSGGVWPQMKLIQGAVAVEGDPEWQVSRGRLLPSHRVLGFDEVTASAREKLEQSLVLVHGGMSQDVGPVLEMVTEKYLLRSPAEWEARQEAREIFDSIVAALKTGDARALGAATTRNFQSPLQTIIPWATNDYTERLIAGMRETFDDDFWGFWMLGGMAGGGMGFIVAPHRRDEAQDHIHELMGETKRRLQDSLPFAIDPVVYDFSINNDGTLATLLHGADALLPSEYYVLSSPAVLRQDPRDLPPTRRTELDLFAALCRARPELAGTVQTLFDRLLPKQSREEGGESLEVILEANAFDRVQHEQIRADLRSGRLGLMQNRLPASTAIRDVAPGDVFDAQELEDSKFEGLGMDLLRDGKVAVVTLAAGLGSRWTEGAGVVKALHPFSQLGGRHRTFIEAHLAKSRRMSRRSGTEIPHTFTTSYLTDRPIASFLKSVDCYDYSPLYLSPGRAVGLRLVPMARDLRFAWEELPQQLLDEQAQKMRESLHAALIEWARSSGEGSDYMDNLPLQCLHPVGHWFEIPNLLQNGVLAKLLDERPKLQYLLVHNIDTVGTDVNPALLGYHATSGASLTFEVIPRWIDDRGGGLARVDGQLRLLEGLAMPREESEFELSYYNTLTTWVDIDQLLRVFALKRSDLRAEPRKVRRAIRTVGARVPTYITLKDVKKRWGHGQEDIFPVAQFEKLWGDMTGLAECHCGFVAVSRSRGQQLKEQAQLDGWFRDGSAAYLESLCEWT